MILSNSFLCCSSRYSYSFSAISCIAVARSLFSCSESSIPASTLLFISASFCIASGETSFRSSSIACFLHFSPIGLANSSSATIPNSHHIIALFTPPDWLIPPRNHAFWNNALIICGLFWYVFASSGSILIASTLAPKSGNSFSTRAFIFCLFCVFSVEMIE